MTEMLLEKPEGKKSDKVKFLLFIACMVLVVVCFLLLNYAGVWQQQAQVCNASSDAIRQVMNCSYAGKIPMILC